MKPSFSSSIALLALSPFATAQLRWAIVPPSADVTLYSESGSVANGAGQNTFLGATSTGDVRRTLLRFDLASVVPAGSILVQGTLVLTVDQGSTTEQPCSLHRVLAIWREGPTDPADEEWQGLPASSGDSTWTLRDFGAGIPWSTPGGDFAVEPTMVSGLRSPLLLASLQLTPRALEDVASWVAQPSQNHGWCLKGAESTASSALRLESRESAQTDARPFLYLAWFPPLAQPAAGCLTSSNSVGPGARIAWSGSTSVSANDFVLSASGLPPNTTGMFLFGPGRGFELWMGNGWLCVPGPRYRVGIQPVGPTGHVTRVLDLSTYPGTALTTMSTASFQFWYRDAAAGGVGFDFSDSLFTPVFP